MTETFEHHRSDIGNTFQQIWSPCTQGYTIHRHLQCIQFPITFQNLIPIWNSQGRPILSKLSYPDGLLYGNSSSEIPTDIEILTSLQEVMILSVFTGYIREGIIPHPKPFTELASHIHIYSSIKVELDTLLHNYSENDQIERYNFEWRSLIAAFDQDRVFCSNLPTHDCIGRLLWGEWLKFREEKVKKEEDYDD